MVFRMAIFFLAGFCFAQEGSVGTPHVYKTVEGKPWRLYVVAPPAAKPGARLPAVVFYHGGGWKGVAATQFNRHSERLAALGMVAIQVEYRPVTGTNDLPVSCMEDTKSSLRWVRAHARSLGIDPKRIAAAGGSAGGHLAAFAGLMDGFDDAADDRAVSAKPNALVLYNPVVDNGPTGWGHERVGERYQEFSPFHNVKKGAPPTIFFVGSDDKLIPTRTAEAFAAKLRAVGTRCDLHIYPGQGHGFFNARAGGNPYYDQTLEKTIGFLTSLGWTRTP